jgi:gliding motility-associated-like protein
VIFPSAKADFNLSNSVVCSPDSVKFTNISTNAFNSFWTFGDGSQKILNNNINVNHLYNNSGSVSKDQAELYIESKNGCSSIKDTLITVYPDIVPGFSADSVGCAPFTVQFNNLTSTSGVSYNWNFGDGQTSTAKNPFNTFENSDTISKPFITKLIVTLNSNKSCKDSAIQNILVYPTLIASFNLDTDQVCAPFRVNITNTSSGACAGCYLWDFGDQSLPSGYTTKTFPHTYPADTNQTTYKIFLTVGNNSNKCKSIDSLFVTVNPPLLASFYIKDTVCSPFTDTLKNQTTGSGRKKYYWSFGDGYTSSLINPLHTFTNNFQLELKDTIKLKATSEYGCSNDTTRVIAIFPAPVANFSIDPALQFFPNATFSFIDYTNKGPWNYLWKFGDNRDTNSIGSVKHTYFHWALKANDYKIPVELVTKNGICADSAFDTLLLYAPVPIANFDTVFHVCDSTIQFINKSTWGDSYSWDFNDKSIFSPDTNPVHTFPGPGEYNVKLTVNSEGGTDSHYKLVQIYPKPSISFVVQPKVVEIKQDVIKCYNNTQNATRYLWNFGESETDTSTEVSPAHTYNDTGTFVVKLFAWSFYGCPDTSRGDTVKAYQSAAQIKYPNAFMPGLPGPGGSLNPNAVFHPAVTDNVSEYHFEIYNRWGERIFVTTDINAGWDGTYKGKLCQQDVYVYKAWGRFLNGRTFVKAGDITLLHKAQ